MRKVSLSTIHALQLRGRARISCQVCFTRRCALRGVARCPPCCHYGPWLWTGGGSSVCQSALAGCTENPKVTEVRGGGSGLQSPPRPQPCCTCCVVQHSTSSCPLNPTFRTARGGGMGKTAPFPVHPTLWDLGLGPYLHSCPGSCGQWGPRPSKQSPASAVKQAGVRP